jgi:hypothetical protein
MAGPRIHLTESADFQDRMARAQDAAGAAFASELSSTSDPARREFLMRKATKAKEQAQFHRDQAKRLRAEAGGE